MSAGLRLIQLARHAACRQTRAVVDALAALPDDADTIVMTLGRHRLIRLVLLATTSADIRQGVPPGLAERLEDWRARTWPSNASMLAAFVDVRARLEEAGIDVLLLKGFPMATRLYGGLEQRPQQDIDVLVRPADLGRTASVLRSAGWRRAGYDGHATTFVRGAAKLDVHRCLRRAPAYRLRERSAWEDAVQTTVEGVSVSTLSDEWTVVLLALATAEELAHGAAKLRALVDLSLLLAHVDPGFDWDRFFARRAVERVDGILANVLSLVVDLFDDRRALPRLTAALEARRAFIVPMTAAERIALVLAPPRAPESLRWFARLYPGSLARYLAAFWWAGFPANVKDLRLSRLLSGGRLAWQSRLREAR